MFTNLMPSSATPTPAPKLSIGDRLHGVWGQGCGESEGVILEVLFPSTVRLGINGPVSYTPQARIINDKGTECVTEIRWRGDGRSISPIGWWYVGPSADWEALVDAWRSERIARDATARKIAELHYVNACAQQCEWKRVCQHQTEWKEGYNGDTLCGAGIDASGAICLASLNRGTRTAKASRFSVGDKCKVGSYNFDYIGTITKITAKTVTVEEHGRTKRFTHRQFHSLNLGWTVERGMETFHNWQD